VGRKWGWWGGPAACPFFATKVPARFLRFGSATLPSPAGASYRRQPNKLQRKSKVKGLCCFLLCCSHPALCRCSYLLTSDSQLSTQRARQGRSPPLKSRIKAKASLSTVQSSRVTRACLLCPKRACLVWVGRETGVPSGTSRGERSCGW